MISLKNRLILTYSLFIGIFILALSLITNQFAGYLFGAFVKDNIKAQSKKIAASLAEQYMPSTGSFNMVTTVALGMNYVHQGYIVSIENTAGNIIWDARACNMQQCVDMIAAIENRMQNEHQQPGKFITKQYPMQFEGQVVGTVHVETYGPFFYSEGEAGFLKALSRFLLIIGAFFALTSVLLSILLATTLSKPILNAAHMAKQISGGNLAVRIPDNHKTKELHELAHSINELAAALENGERWQKRLTSDIAHELRTPLTTLQGNVEAMIDGVWEPTPQRLISCHEEIVRLSKLVADLGQLSILESEVLQLHKTPFDLAKLLYSLLQQYTPAATEKNIALQAHLQESILDADYDRLTQVFVNLLSNSIKYTEKGSISVHIENLGAHCLITIADSGIGIPEDELPHIFERFYRSDKSRSHATGGAGIGLTVVKAIVEAHCGSIRASSEAGKGSIFLVELPK